jgi:hypothetical protein
MVSDREYERIIEAPKGVKEKSTAELTLDRLGQVPSDQWRRIAPYAIGRHGSEEWHYGFETTLILSGKPFSIRFTWRRTLLDVAGYGTAESGEAFVIRVAENAEDGNEHASFELDYGNVSRPRRLYDRLDTEVEKPDEESEEAASTQLRNAFDATLRS